MLIPSWIRKMNIVLFERNALVDKSFVRSKAVDLLTLWRKSLYDRHRWVMFGCVSQNSV
jgi:hypothetical protein